MKIILISHWLYVLRIWPFVYSSDSIKRSRPWNFYVLAKKRIFCGIKKIKHYYLALGDCCSFYHRSSLLHFFNPEIKRFTSTFTPLISKNCILVDFLLSIKTTYLGRGRGSRLLPWEPAHTSWQIYRHNKKPGKTTWADLVNYRMFCGIVNITWIGCRNNVKSGWGRVFFGFKICNSKN